MPPQFAALRDFFLGGNTLVRFGVIVFFFGVAFLLKFASEHIESHRGAAHRCRYRSGGDAGYRLAPATPAPRLRVDPSGRRRRRFVSYGLRRFPALSVASRRLDMALLAAMAIFLAMLAVLQDSRSLAALGVSGGFLAPIFASTGGGSHVMPFSFYALLNFGILFITWFKTLAPRSICWDFYLLLSLGVIWGGALLSAGIFSQHGTFCDPVLSFSTSLLPCCSRCGRTPALKIPVGRHAGIRRADYRLRPAMRAGARISGSAAAFSALALSGFLFIAGEILVLPRRRRNLRPAPSNRFLAARRSLSAPWQFLSLSTAAGRRRLGLWRARRSSGSACARKKFSPAASAIFLLYASGAAFFLRCVGLPRAPLAGI